MGSNDNKHFNCRYFYVHKYYTLGFGFSPMPATGTLFTRISSRMSPHQPLLFPEISANNNTALPALNYFPSPTLRNIQNSGDFNNQRRLDQELSSFPAIMVRDFSQPSRLSRGWLQTGSNQEGSNSDDTETTQQVNTSFQLATTSGIEDTRTSRSRLPDITSFSRLTFLELSLSKLYEIYLIKSQSMMRSLCVTLLPCRNLHQSILNGRPFTLPFGPSASIQLYVY